MSALGIKLKIPPNKLYQYFEETIGFDSISGKKFGIWIELSEDKFIKFLDSLSDNDYLKLAEARERYDTYITPIIKVGALYEMSYVVLVLVALIEYVMNEKEFITLDIFLKDSLREGMPIDKALLCELINKYYEERGERRLVNKFFKTYLSQYENTILDNLKQCNGWKDCDTFKKFVDRVLEYRNNFVHGLSKKVIWPFDVKPILDESLKIRGFQKTLSISDLIKIVWIGVFKRFGFNTV